MTWPADKLTLINQSLALTGNNLVNVAEDGSDEWAVCSAAYEKALEYMLDNHDWKQLTTVTTLTSTGVAPTDTNFDTAFAKPSDCVHVLAVGINQSGDTGGWSQPLTWQILNNQIVCNLFGGASPSPGATIPIVSMRYVSSSPPGVGGQPSVPITQMLRTFMTALSTFVEAGIYQGLHEDLAAARQLKAEAVELLAEARRRADQEQPKRAPFNSRITASRRVRRPWPPVPPGWSGTGIPG